MSSSTTLPLPLHLCAPTYCRCCFWLQVASGFLIEIGKRDKLLFDLGTGAYVNLVATGVPQGDVTKVGPGRGGRVPRVTGWMSQMWGPEQGRPCPSKETSQGWGWQQGGLDGVTVYRLSPPSQVFLSHLHSDHIADLASLYVGAMFGRLVPWEVWGPSSEIPEVGTAAVIDGLRKVSGGQGGGRGWGY